MELRSIATRYAALVVALLSVALIVSGAVQTWSAHRDRQAAFETLQRAKAQAAAVEVSRFTEDILRSLDWVTLSAVPAGSNDIERRRLEFLKLLRLEPAITTATLVGADGRELLRVSRIEADRLSSGIDLSGEPAFGVARTTRAHFSDVRFVAQTEPYLTVAAPSAARDGSVVIADVNLKFVRTVVSDIKVGETGYAYVVDARGRLVSHPEMSLVLQMTDMSRLPQVQAAIASGAPAQGFADDARALDGSAVLAAYAKIAPSSWTVFVEQPRAEALAPLMNSIERSALTLIIALVLAVTAGVFAARRMVAPIGELRRGAQRYGAGDFAHRIEVNSGDELQELAANFNAMGEQLREIYGSLERRVNDRTRELNERNVEIQQKSRQLDEANQAKSRLLAAASHDLRQPMHALSLFVGQLKESNTTAERIALMQRIERAVGSLSELLDQLLDLSKLEAGAVQAVQQDFAVGDMLSEIGTEFASLARVKGIELRVLPTDAWLRSDPVLLRRILLNLVANAIRYTERGGVLIGCRKRGHIGRIAVWDTGCGIPDDRFEDVFHEFVQLAAAEPRHADRSGRGLGLGLSIVARLADLLGTKVELRSTVGRGSMFAVELPRGVASAAAQQPLMPSSVTALRGTFALVIDDDEAARAGMCGLLETWGCVTLSAQDSSDAVAQLPAHDRLPELIICDYWLTNETGLDAIERMRAAIGGRVPAVLVTAETSRSVLIAAQAVGTPLLHKPVSPLKLRALLAQLLSSPDSQIRIAA
jgi:signal transduction histidine kinase/CheY-like chemotaxis protein